VIVAESPTQEPHGYDLAAFVGTAVGDHLEEAWIATHPETTWVKQASVTISIRVRGYILNIPGHPDLYCRTDLIDFKTKDGLGTVRRSGPTQQERFQRTLYAAALIDSGRMDEDCWLHNVYVDRSGADSEPVVWSERFDRSVVEEAREWLADAIYAVEHGEEASRDKPREWCWACCPFAPACRGDDDTDVEGYTDDPVLVDAVRVYMEARAAIAAAEKDKKSAESVLRDVSGTVGHHKVRWIEVGPTIIPEQHRSGYRRIDVRPVTERKKPERKQRRNGHDDRDRGGSAGTDQGAGGAGESGDAGHAEPGGEGRVAESPAQP
jgi:hypothetical protein